MPKLRVTVPELTVVDLISRCNNRCCVCQTPFIVKHHIDEDPSNNVPENLVPLCPNCHTQAHSKNNMVVNLRPDRIKKLREIWYAYCDQRKESTTPSEPHAVAKLIAFIQFLESDGYLPSRGWKRTFAVIHPEYAELRNKLEMAERLFSTSNRADLVTYLEAVKGMYAERIGRFGIEEKFVRVCNAFGIDYDELI